VQPVFARILASIAARHSAFGSLNAFEPVVTVSLVTQSACEGGVIYRMITENFRRSTNGSLSLS
jgi:hypothetical protein